MNKSKSTAKLQLVKNNNKKKYSAPASKGDSSQVAGDNPKTLEQLATVDFWKHEILNLKAEKFDSIQHAVEKLIDQVLERLQLKSQGEEDIREFLRLVFESSEILQDTLRKTLNLS